MYAVVGCEECHALWIVEGRPDTSQCPRCGKTRSYDKRRQFVTTDDEDHAREVRSSMLAARQGHEDAFADLDSFAEMDHQLDEAGIDDETYLEASGIDPDEVGDAGEHDATTKNREEIVRDALRELDDPTGDEVVAYATARDVPAEYAERVLDKLARAGEVTNHRGTYRLL